MSREFRRCKGIATNESTGGDPAPCNNWALRGSDYCQHHDPDKTSPPRKNKLPKPPGPYVGNGICKNESKPCGNPASKGGYCWVHESKHDPPS